MVVPQNPALRRFALVVLFAFGGVAFSTCQRPTGNRVQSKDGGSDVSMMNILATVNELSKLSIEKEKPLNEESRNTMRQLVNNLATPNDVATLARICRAFMIHDWAGDGKSYSDLVVIYDETFWYCVKVLAADLSEGKKRQLQRLKETSSLNDTESGYFTSIIEGTPFP